MAYNDLTNELGQNFIEYAAAVNTDRAIPDATSGLKPVARRILYGAYSGGRVSSKPYVKCARIVGDVMGSLHPHGDSSIYGALVRLSQPWIMRYPLMDFHGNQGNIGGDGPAASRYTESRLMKLTEEGMLNGLKKKCVDFIPNYDETTTEPTTLPSIFPNLLCNPNTGIGVAIACNWLPHNLREVADTINKYINGEKIDFLAPDFPTGGIIINKNDIPSIVKTGKGSVKVRAKYKIENNKIIYYEIPYGTNIESLISEIGVIADNEIDSIKDVHDETNKKGIRIVVECAKGTEPEVIVNKLWNKTNLQTSISYNQVALIDKTPTEMNLEDCLNIYIKHNSSCIVKEAMFDIDKTTKRLHIIVGLIKALDIIDDIIAMIKSSESSAKAKETLIQKWNFSEDQAKAILDMKLSRLAKLEKEELESEKIELEQLLIKLKEICENPIPELQSRLNDIVRKYGDDRRTELTQITITKEEKEIQYVEPEKCVVVMTESGLVKRIPTTSFRTQNRNTKGVKTTDDIVKAVIRTNTVDNLMIFTNKGKMYKLLVDSIPVGTNKTNGVSVASLVQLEQDEKATTIYSIYRDTDAKYVVFITKNGLIKKTSLEEYNKTRKKTGIVAIKLKDGDELVDVFLANEEDIIILTEKGKGIRFKSTDVGATGKTTSGMKSITLGSDDCVVTGLPVRNNNDNLAIFSKSGLAKQIELKDLPSQSRGGKGLICYKGEIAAATLISDGDKILVCGNKSSLCITANEIPIMNRIALGNQIIKGSQILEVSKV